MIRPRTAVLCALAASIIAIVTTALSSGGVSAALANAYTYPNSQGLGLDEAVSMTLTYLFLIGGGALVTSVLYLAARPLTTSKRGWWLGAIFALLGLMLAVYNSTQVLPLAIKVVFFLPVAAGVVWLSLPNAGKPERRRVSPAES